MKRVILVSILIISSCSISRMGPISQAKPLAEVNQVKQTTPNAAEKTITSTPSAITGEERKRRDSIYRSFVNGMISPYIADLKLSQQQSSENLERIFKIQSLRADSLYLQNLAFQNGLNLAVMKLDSQTREGFKKDWKIDSLTANIKSLVASQNKISGFVDGIMEFYNKFSRVAFWLMILYLVILWGLRGLNFYYNSKKAKLA